MERASFKLPFVSCAATVSSVMKESGLFEDFKETVFPKGIKNYLDKFIKEDTHGNFTGKINNMTIELKAYNLGDEKNQMERIMVITKDRLILMAGCLIVYFAEFILGWNYFSFFQTELKILWIVLFAASFAATFMMDFITTSKKIKYMLYGFIGLLTFIVPPSQGTQN